MGMNGDEEEHEDDFLAYVQDHIELFKNILKARYFNKEKPSSYLNLIFMSGDICWLDEAVLNLTID